MAQAKKIQNPLLASTVSLVQAKKSRTLCLLQTLRAATWKWQARPQKGRTLLFSFSHAHKTSSCVKSIQKQNEITFAANNQITMIFTGRAFLFLRLASSVVADCSESSFAASMVNVSDAGCKFQLRLFLSSLIPAWLLSVILTAFLFGHFDPAAPFSRTAEQQSCR